MYEWYINILSIQTVYTTTKNRKMPIAMTNCIWFVEEIKFHFFLLPIHRNTPMQHHAIALSYNNKNNLFLIDQTIKKSDFFHVCFVAGCSSFPSLLSSVSYIHIDWYLSKAICIRNFSEIKIERKWVVIIYAYILIYYIIWWFFRKCFLQTVLAGNKSFTLKIFPIFDYLHGSIQYLHNTIFTVNYNEELYKWKILKKKKQTPHFRHNFSYLFSYVLWIFLIFI